MNASPTIHPDAAQRSDRLHGYLQQDPGNDRLRLDAFDAALAARQFERAQAYLEATDGTLPWVLRAGALQVALGVMLLVGSALLIRSVQHLAGQAPGFDATNVVTASPSLQDARYRDADTINRLFTESLRRIRMVPGVQQAAVSLTLPYERPLNHSWRLIGADPPDRAHAIVNVTYVTPGYFDTYRIPLRGGRLFSEADASGADAVAIVNVALVLLLVSGVVNALARLIVWKFAGRGRTQA